MLAPVRDCSRAGGLLLAVRSLPLGCVGGVARSGSPPGRAACKGASGAVMGKRRHTNIVIRGKTYATCSDAAEAVGVSAQSICRAINEGKLDTVGLGPGVGHRMPVFLGGQVFASVGKAARFAGCSPSTVSKAISAGDPDRILRKHPGSAKRADLAFALWGNRFDSRADLARRTGLSRTFVYRAFSTRCPRRMERLYAAVMASKVAA